MKILLTTKNGFAGNLDREAKALKILAVFNESKNFENTTEKLSLLDIGTGNGEIASYLAKYFTVTSVDIVDQRQTGENFKFILINNPYLPFANETFDYIVSNHVVEHIEDCEFHFTEIARVLKPNGLVYLATPNRLWPWEVHYKLPILHYLPQPIFIDLLKIFGKFLEPVRLLTWWSLKDKTKTLFSLTVFSDRMLKWPDRYYLTCNSMLSLLMSLIPLRVYRAITFIHPTLVVVLSLKKEN